METLDSVMDRFCKSVHQQQSASACSVEPTYSQLTLSKIIKEQPGMLSADQLIQRKQFLQEQIENLRRDVAAAQAYSEVTRSGLLVQSQNQAQNIKTPLQYSKYPEDEKQLLVELLARYEPEKLAAFNRQAKLKKSDVQFIRDTDDIAQKISIFTDNPEETAETYSYLDATTQKTQVKMTVEEAQQKQMAADNFSLKKRLATYRCYYRETIDEMKRIKEKTDLMAQKAQMYEQAAVQIQGMLKKADEAMQSCAE